MKIYTRPYNAFICFLMKCYRVWECKHEHLRNAFYKAVWICHGIIVSVQRLFKLKFISYWFFLIFDIFCTFHMSSRKQQHRVMYKIKQRICIKGKKTHLLKHTALSASPIAMWSKYRNRKRIIPTDISTYIIFIPFASVIKGKNGLDLDFIHGVQWYKHLYLGIT